jgi:serine/threonine protein kinase
MLLVGPVVRLGVVGCAKASAATMEAHSGFSTPDYTAPEMFNGEVGPASDVFGLGGYRVRAAGGSPSFPRD